MDTIDMEERRKLYSETRQDLLTRQLSNSQNFDKAILSLSTASLGFSLAFIKDIIPLGQSSNIWLLVSSWILFIIAISATLVSYVTSYSAIKKQLAFAEKYYIQKQDEYLNKRNWQAELTEYLFYASMVIFVLAIALTILFVSINSLGGSL